MGVHFDWALWMLFAFWLTGIYFSFGPHFTSHYPPRKKHCHISRLTLTCPVEKRQRRNDAATPKTPTWESIGCRRDGCASFQRKIYNYNPLLVGSHTLVHFEGLVSVLLGKSVFSSFSGLEIASYSENYVKNGTGLRGTEKEYREWHYVVGDMLVMIWVAWDWGTGAQAPPI